MSLTVDTTAPEQPVIATNIATTTDSTPTIVISADAGTTVTLFSNGTILGTGVANSLVTITTPQLEDGVYDLTATSTDSAGNISDSSTELSFSIDSTAVESIENDNSVELSEIFPALSVEVAVKS